MKEIQKFLSYGQEVCHGFCFLFVQILMSVQMQVRCVEVMRTATTTTVAMTASVAWDTQGSMVFARIIMNVQTVTTMTVMSMQNVLIPQALISAGASEVTRATAWKETARVCIQSQLCQFLVAIRQGLSSS